MKRITLGTLFRAATSLAAEPKTFTGVITDTMCGKAHGMTAGQPDDKCIAMCVRGSSSQYALFDGKEVLKLSDQKRPAKFASKRVKVSGILNEKTKTIKVESMEAEGIAQ